MVANSTMNGSDRTMQSTEPPRGIAVWASDSLPTSRPVHAAVGDFHRSATPSYCHGQCGYKVAT